MTRALPSLEAPAPGTVCEHCGEEVRLSAPSFCASCFERDMEERERLVRAQLALAKRRARTWQLSRAVPQ